MIPRMATESSLSRANHASESPGPEVTAVTNSFRPWSVIQGGLPPVAFIRRDIAGFKRKLGPPRARSPGFAILWPWFKVR